MAVQSIDNFSKTLDPAVKAAVEDACICGTKARAVCFENAYANDAKVNELRDLSNAIKSTKISENLEKAIANLEANGVVIHYANDSKEANEIIEKILKEENAKSVVKVKSMTSEEIELNHFLEAKGYNIIETDLGEFIIQLRNEKPSHIVKPALHLKRQQFAKSFAEHNVAPYNDDPTAITLSARKFLRGKYIKADVAISGANYILAEEGGIVLCTNEGNARFCLAGAKTHIAIAGFEKVIPSAKELSVFLNLLARSATGQHITTYNDFVFGKGSAKNSPKKMHLVFLDNGRSEILSSDFSEILKCIRCGACMQRCPVFRKVSGHAYRATYPGPLGIILSPLLGDNLSELRDLPKACTLCGACQEVCPSNIPLPNLILKMRDKVKTEHLKVPNDINFFPFKILATMPWLWKFGMTMSSLANFVPLSWVKFGPLGRWNKSRTLPTFKGGKFRKWFARKAK